MTEDINSKSDEWQPFFPITNKELIYFCGLHLREYLTTFQHEVLLKTQNIHVYVMDMLNIACGHLKIMRYPQIL